MARNSTKKRKLTQQGKEMKKPNTKQHLSSYTSGPILSPHKSVVVEKILGTIELAKKEKNLVVMMSSGPDICTDVLQEIFKRITLHADILSFAVVCKRWRSIVMDSLCRIPQHFPLSYCLPRQHQLPLLMQCNDEEDVGKINFLSVADNKSFTDFVVPEISGNWIAGSSNGCLVLNEVVGDKVHLFNPLTRAHISLPSLSTFDRRKFCRGSPGYVSDKLAYVRRVLVLSEPNAMSLDGCIVIAIVSHWPLLSFCRPGDDKWTNIQGSPILVDDVICFKGQLYAIVHWGALLSFDFEHRRVNFVAGHPVKDREPEKRYLVESSTSGDLLIVLRTLADGRCTASNFSVFSLEEVDETQDRVIQAHYVNYNAKRIEQAVKYKWVQVERLDDQILFVGRNCPKSVPASLYPHLKGNCICCSLWRVSRSTKMALCQIIAVEELSTRAAISGEHFALRKHKRIETNQDSHHTER